MRYELPNHLRLHVTDDMEWTNESDHGAELDCLCQAFTLATGWQLDHHTHGPSPLAVWSTQLVDVHSDRPVTLELSAPVDEDRQVQTAMSRTDARGLAEELAKLMERLHRAERALWEREGELAAAVPLVTRPEDESMRLAARLEAIVKGGVELVDGAAGALYLLDDATSQLKLRSQWGLPHSRFADAPRPLRTAKGDLEALAGQAVVLEDVDALPHWNAPERFPAAVCVPVSTATFPLGTLWVFASTKCDFSERQVHLLEIVAGRLAVELEREILLRDHVARKRDNHLEEAVAWQLDSLPAPALDLPGWDVAGALGYENSLNSETYHWHVDDTGRFRFSLCSVYGAGLSATLTAAQLSGVFIPVDETSEPATTMHRVNRMLWNGSAGGRLASAWCGVLEPHSGRLTGQAAGDLFVYVIRPHGWEFLVQPSMMLGHDEDVASVPVEQWLLPGDTLLALSGQRRHATRREIDGNSEANKCAETLLRCNHLSAREMTQLLRAHWNAQQSQWLAPPAMLVAKYLDL